MGLFGRKKGVDAQPESREAVAAPFPDVTAAANSDVAPSAPYQQAAPAARPAAYPTSSPLAAAYNHERDVPEPAYAGTAAGAAVPSEADNPFAADAPRHAASVPRHSNKMAYNNGATDAGVYRDQHPTGPVAAGAIDAAAAPAAAATAGPQPTFREKLETASTTTVSGLSVLVLVIWTILVAGWTGFQVVQNAIVWSQLQHLGFPRPGNPQIARNNSQGIQGTETKALWAIVGIESFLFLLFIPLAIALAWVPYIRACRQHRRALRTKKDLLPWLVTLLLVATAWFKLFTLTSVLNKMAYQGTWCATTDNLDIQYTFNPQSTPQAGCNLAPVATGIRQVMVFAMLTIAFHMLMFFWHQPKGTLGKILGFLPAVLVAALLVLKPVTSLMNWYYTQNYFYSQGNFTYTAEIIVALIEFITAVWLSVYLGWAIHSLRLLPRFINNILACCGKDYEDVYYEKDVDPVTKEEVMEAGGKPGRRPRRHYRFRAAAKSVMQQYYYMMQLPAVFGFVSPMITYFALGVRSWWIVFDIIVGAVLIASYIVLCTFHRRILSPPKH